MVSTNSTSQAEVATMTCPGPGEGSGSWRSSRTSGPPKRATSTARTSGHLVPRDVPGHEARVVGVDVEGDDPPGMNPDDLGRQMALPVVRPDRGLGHAADLEEVGTVHRLFGDLVHDEGHVRIRLDVAVLGAAAHVETGDVDGAERRVDRETQGLDLWGPVRPQRGQVTSGLAGEKAHFGVAEDHGGQARTSSKVEVKDKPPGGTWESRRGRRRAAAGPLPPGSRNARRPGCLRF